MNRKTIITCALTGVLTDPKETGVPVTPGEMAEAAYEAFNAGASIVHCHFRSQEPGQGHLATWDPDVAEEISTAIRAKAPELILNLSTGVVGSDIKAPIRCLERVKPEMAALNAGSLNYLKIKKDGTWAWPPFLFDNPVPKVEAFLSAMNRLGIRPECECFDTGIVRSIAMYEQAGLLKSPSCVSLVMGVASGMPAKPEWVPLLIPELPEKAHWQTIVIGREEVWPVLKKAIECGGDVRTGLEDTFYLPDGRKTRSNGSLIEALAKLVRSSGHHVASPAEARAQLGMARYLN